ncbi:MAG TPA: flagellar export chaperone FliS [Acidimicrobiales bacterium]|nr:flagellar export chaperone FliS [Acidimicrobiales bacterium]
MPPTRARNTYLANAVAGAPPERLLTMLYDALVSNLTMAEAAMVEKDYFTFNEKLLRAQEIVLELRGTLKPEMWAGGPALLSIYDFVYKLLVRANVHKDSDALRDARRLIEPLQAAWHAAAEQVLAARSSAPSPAMAASA